MEACPGSAGVLAGRVNNKRAPTARFKCRGRVFAPHFIYYTTGEDASAPMSTPQYNNTPHKHSNINHLTNIYFPFILKIVGAVCEPPSMKLLFFSKAFVSRERLSKKNVR